MLASTSAATDLDLISHLRLIPDARMRRGVRFATWYLLLMAVLGILSGCQNLRNTDLDQLVCDGKTLRGSIEPMAGGGSAFISQVTLHSAALDVAISQTCYATGENHKRAVLRQLLGELDLEGVLIQADGLHT